jgi:hypothetical protein
MCVALLMMIEYRCELCDDNQGQYFNNQQDQQEFVDQGKYSMGFLVVLFTI